jgi:hypothetical protein
MTVGRMILRPGWVGSLVNTTPIGRGVVWLVQDGHDPQAAPEGFDATAERAR